MIDLSLIKVIPPEEYHREFYYTVKKEAYGGYITRIWGWNEKKERDFQTKDWQEKRPSIVTYNNQPIGTIYVKKDENSIEIGQFYILPEYQNHGIGSHVVKGILDNADRARLIVKLMYLRINPAASLYARMGFKVVREEEPFILAERKPNTIAKNNRKYQAVIFDLFGTLVNIFSREKYYKTLEEMASALKAPYTEFEKVRGKTDKQRTIGEFRTLEENIEYIGRELKINFSKNQIERACKIRMDFVAQALTPKPGALETLVQLKSAGYKIALISNCSTEPPVLWPDTPFAPFFNVVIFSSTCGLQKPDSRIYLLAAEKLAVKPKDCLYIGDGDGNELTGAAQVGMNPVLIRDTREDSIHALYSDDYQGKNWDGRVISSLKEVLELLEE